jgi:hypothetical protein
MCCYPGKSVIFGTTYRPGKIVANGAGASGFAEDMFYPVESFKMA